MSPTSDLANMLKDLADADIRARDPDYKQMQLAEVSKAIKELGA